MPHARPQQSPAAAQPSTSAAQQPVRRLGGDIQPARSMHAQPQKSKTLMRSVLKSPQPIAHPAQPVKRSPQIQRFSKIEPSQYHAPKPAAVAPLQHVTAHTPVHSGHSQAAPAHRAPVRHPEPVAPIVSQVPAPLRGTHLKEALINEQLAGILPKTAQQHKNDEHAVDDDRPRSKFSAMRGRHPRIASAVAGIAALVILGGYLTYLNLPSLSIKVAASQAGFSATYPSYQPAGYSFNGPVAFSPGEVKVHFKSNTNDYAYTLVQQASGWDSQAVLDNFVVKQSQEYATLQERGLTIYLYDNKATWVNGGVLYTIDGNAPLSSEQIQKIASSTL